MLHPGFLQGIGSEGELWYNRFRSVPEGPAPERLPADRRADRGRKEMTFIYPAVFHVREDGKYEGRFVDLAMCYGVGDTLDEAIRECIEAEREWIQLELREDEWDIPEVTNIDDIELKEGEIARNIAAKVRILEGWEE